MLTALIVSQVISWGVVLALVVAVLALARQVGVLHMRVAPAGGGLRAGPGGAVMYGHALEMADCTPAHSSGRLAGWNCTVPLIFPSE